MESLFSSFNTIIEQTDTKFIRYIYSDINWNNRLIAITGARGCGKTTLLLQHIKKAYSNRINEVLYVSLDNIWFTTHNLVQLADEFNRNGGKILFLDEVHKYPSWSIEIKNIYDSYPNLKIVFTGSSLLEIYKSEADLSRRAITYHLYGLSFREFIELEYGIKLKTYSLDDIISNHINIASEINKEIKPIPAFKEYLKYGYFPFFKEDKNTYLQRLLNTLNTILEVDLPSSQKIDFYSIHKIKKLFYIMSSLVPFTPNITQLSKEIDVTRISLLNYLTYLEKAQAILMLNKDALGMKYLAKPEKIYLANTNYAFALAGDKTNIGSIRETFFYNQLMVRNDVLFSNKTDFFINNKYSFEVGGKNKTNKQIKDIEDSFVVKDDIEIGYFNNIPLWLFGFLY